jgi:hypothetical protein
MDGERVTYRILITGSRTWSDRHAIHWALVEAGRRSKHDPPGVLVIHGGADGADTIAAEEATALRCCVRKYPADWDRCDVACPPGHRKSRRGGGDYCPMAGHRRNARMVELGADVCLAFPHGAARGTRDCMARAEAAGIPVIVHEQGGGPTETALAVVIGKAAQLGLYESTAEPTETR